MRMNKKSKVTLVPKLRFPEFHSTGEWEISKLSNLASKITVRNQENLINRVLTNSAVEGVVDQSDYFDREVANQNNLENYFVIDEGDYVYNPRISATAPVGPISKNKVGRGVMSPLYTVFRFENPNNDFYEQYFKTNCWHAYLKSVSNTGARHDRMSISNGNFMKIPVPYPSEGEQQKIADCLSSLDDLITAEDEKLEVLKTHKKGLMQKLFPAEGKTIPEWRFPEFRDSGDWNNEEISRIGEIVTGKTPDTTNESLWNGDIQFVTPTDISENKYQLKTQRTVANNTKIKILPKNSILFTCIASIGKMAISVCPCITNQQINTVIPYNSFNYEYIYYALLKKSYLIKSRLANTTLPIINKTEFSKFMLAVPKDPKEQQIIADCLSVLDTFITAQSEKVETLKAHKRGLMQGLFPSFEAGK